MNTNNFLFYKYIDEIDSFYDYNIFLQDRIYILINYKNLLDCDSDIKHKGNY